jgi:hypothetical protein
MWQVPETHPSEWVNQSGVPHPIGLSQLRERYARRCVAATGTLVLLGGEADQVDDGVRVRGKAGRLVQLPSGAAVGHPESVEQLRLTDMGCDEQRTTLLL